MSIVVPIAVMFVVGIAVGALASGSKLMRGRGFGLNGNISSGLIGSFIGGLIHIGIIRIGGVLGTLILATIGAVIILLVIGLVKKDRHT